MRVFVLNELSQTEKKKILYGLTYVESKKTELIDKVIRFVVTRGGGLRVGAWGKEGQNIQTPSYDINKN